MKFGRPGFWLFAGGAGDAAHRHPDASTADTIGWSEVGTIEAQIICTTTIINCVLERLGYHTYLGGNIGTTTHGKQKGVKFIIKVL